MRFLGKVILKAGGSHGSILGPLLFLIFMNGIADETIVLCRLFADDTSIGEKS
jgi:mannose/fructose/N-acetylgalactosamine-specific phosphotransferase system component IID